MWSLFSVFTLFYLIFENTCQLMWDNFVFLVIFDTCDVVYNRFISLLPPIVLDNLFATCVFSSYYLTQTFLICKHDLDYIHAYSCPTTQLKPSQYVNMTWIVIVIQAFSRPNSQLNPFSICKHDMSWKL